MSQITVYSGPEYALAKANPQEIVEMIRANLGAGAESVSRFDLPRVTVPAAAGIAWNVPGPDGEPMSEKELTGVVLFQADKRALWLTEYGDGETGPPDCSSEDAVWGEGRITRDGAKGRWKCATCPMAEFGTKPGRKEGTFRAGQACGARKLLFLARQDQILPTVIDLSPASLKAWKKFMMNLTAHALPIHGVVVALGLAAEKSDDNIPYSRVAPRIVARLAPEQVSRMREYAVSMKEIFNAEPAVRVTVDGAPVGDREVIDTTARDASAGHDNG